MSENSVERSGNINEDNKQNIPKLRFEEFNDEWNKTRLNEICEVQDGTHTTPNYVDKGIPFFSVDTIINHVPPKHISKEDHEKLIKRCHPKKGDILMTRITGGILGYPQLVDWNYDFSIYVSLALLSDIKINSKYLNYYIQSPIYRNDFLSKSLLIESPPKINLSDLESTLIKYPKSDEQEKIANFLSLIDWKIELMEKKYTILIKYHRYLIKKLINNYDFSYNEVSLNQILQYISSNLSLNNLEEHSGIYPLFGADGFVKNIDFYEMDEEYIGIVKDGAGVGRITYNNKKTSILGTMGYLTSTKDINLKYIYYYLSTINLKKYIVGSTIPHIYFKDYSKEIIRLPELKEQEKTVALLDYINKVILNLNKKIEINKNFKKSLLSKMFC